MNTNHLISFLVLTETNSYQKAAEQLHYSRSTVMEHIRALEQELGTSLFYSQGRKLIPTLAGERFRVHAQSIIQTYQNALVETMTFSQNKKLRIITVETLGLYFLNTPLLKLIQTYPEIDLSVSFVPASESQDLLRREKADIAILFSGQPWDTIPATGLRQEILCQDESVFFTNPNSCLAKKPGLHIEDLLDAKFILTRKDGLYSGHLARIFKDTGVRIVPMQYIDSGPLLKQFVIKHDCVSMLSRRVIQDELEKGELIELPLIKEKLMADVVAMYPSREEKNPAIRQFVRLAAYCLK